MAVYGNRLYVSTGEFPIAYNAKVWEFDGTSWIQSNCSGFGDLENKDIMSMAVFADRLHLGVSNDFTGVQAWSYSDLASRLVGHYPFINGSADDVSGRGNHGIIFGAPAMTTDRVGLRRRRPSFR